MNVFFYQLTELFTKPFDGSYDLHNFFLFILLILRFLGQKWPKMRFFRHYQKSVR